LHLSEWRIGALNKTEGATAGDTRFFSECNTSIHKRMGGFLIERRPFYAYRKEVLQLKWEAVSLDMFQTLVDVDRRIPAIWKRILKQDYTLEKAEQYGCAIMEEFMPVYRAASEREEFIPLKLLYVQSFCRMFQKRSLLYDPTEAAKVILTEHANAPFYAEVPPVLDRLSKTLPLYLSSDADHIMIDALIPQIPLRQAFLSEDLRTYKRNSHGRFFESVLEQTGIDPDKILHVGDGAADVLGASRTGMKSCLIDRAHKGTPTGCRPDYVIHSFDELLEFVL
jgi:FMN phosphatase YigB (HAD superfamily)